MIEITIIYWYITENLKINRQKYTFGYSQKLMLNTKLAYYW